jgi:hypothetical protein
MSELKSEIESFIEIARKAEEELQRKCESTLKTVFQKFWERNPEVNSVVWHQYAPYFNDGEPCEFSVHDPLFSNASKEEDIDDIRWDYEGKNEEIWCWKNYGNLPDKVGKNFESDTKALSSFLCSSASEGTMKLMFGSDSRVVATREGFQTSDYSGSHV